MSYIPILASPGSQIDTIDDGRQIGSLGTLRSLGEMLRADTGARRLWIGDVDPFLAGVAQVGDAWLDTFSYVFDPEAGVWPAITEVPVSNATNTYTRSIITPPVDLNGTAQTKVARIAWASGAQASDRRVHTFDGCGLLDDVEILTLLYNRKSPQQGVALRINNIGNTTLQKMYAIWNDQIVNYNSVFNTGTWNGIDASFVNSQPGGQYFESLEDVVGVFTMTRASNVVTATIPHNHLYRVADQITIVAAATTSFNGTFSIASVTGDSVTWSQTGANETATAFGVAGFMGTPFGHATYPHWLKVRLIGAQVRTKVWRQGVGEPSWSDPRASVVWNDTTPIGPTGVGKVGLIYSHGKASGDLVDFGRTIVCRPERGFKVRESTGWRSVLPIGT